MKDKLKITNIQVSEGDKKYYYIGGVDNKAIAGDDTFLIICQKILEIL